MPLLLEWDNSRRHKGLFRLGRKDGFKLSLRQMQEHAADFFKLNGAVITGGILGAAGDGVGQAVVRKVAVRNKVAQNIVLFVLGETVGLAQRLDALFHMPGDGAGIGGLHPVDQLLQVVTAHHLAHGVTGRQGKGAGVRLLRFLRKGEQ